MTRRPCRTRRAAVFRRETRGLRRGGDLFGPGGVGAERGYDLAALGRSARPDRTAEGDGRVTEIKDMSFEEAMKELEATVGKLEHGEATLEESIALYERGAKLRKHCDEALRKAEERVEKITLAANGQPSGTTPAEGL